LTANTNIPIKYLPVRAESREDFATVRTVISINDGNRVSVNYRLYCRDAAWKLFDVTIAGVSVVTTVRSAFLSEVKKSGLDGLIELLERKSKAVGT
jgi:phospholipid transport system substrate-binding protein